MALFAALAGFGAGYWSSRPHTQGRTEVIARQVSGKTDNAPVQSSPVETLKTASRDVQVQTISAVFAEWENALKKEQSELTQQLLAARQRVFQSRPDIAALDRFLREELPDWWKNNDPDGRARFLEWQSAGTDEEINRKAAFGYKLAPLLRKLGAARLVLDENQTDPAWAEFRQVPPPRWVAEDAFAATDKLTGIQVEDDSADSWQTRMLKRRELYTNFFRNAAREEGLSDDIADLVQIPSYLDVAGAMTQNLIERAMEQGELPELRDRLAAVGERLEAIHNTGTGLRHLFQHPNETTHNERK